MADVLAPGASAGAVHATARDAGPATAEPRLVRAAQRRLARPTTGILGPVLLALGAVTVATGLLMLTGPAFQYSWLVAGAGAAIALGTAPLWMVNVARRTGRRASQHPGAEATRRRNEEAYLRGVLDEAEFQRGEGWLAGLAEGRCACRLQHQVHAYLAGTAWSLLGGGLLLAAGAATTWVWLSYMNVHLYPGILTTATVALAVAVAAPVALGPAAWFVRHAARSRAEEEHQRLQEAHLDLLQRLRKSSRTRR